MNKAYSFPLSPNCKQEELFWRCAGTARWAYNWALATCKTEHELLGKKPNAYELIKRITVLKRTDKNQNAMFQGWCHA